LEVTTQGGRDSDQGGVPVVQATQYQRCDQRLIDRCRDWTPDAAKLAQRSETPGYCPLNEDELHRPVTEFMLDTTCHYSPVTNRQVQACLKVNDKGQSH